MQRSWKDVRFEIIIISLHSHILSVWHWLTFISDFTKHQYNIFENLQALDGIQAPSDWIQRNKIIKPHNSKSSWPKSVLNLYDERVQIVDFFMFRAQFHLCIYYTKSRIFSVLVLKKHKISCSSKCINIDLINCDCQNTS